MSRSTANRATCSNQPPFAEVKKRASVDFPRPTLFCFEWSNPPPILAKGLDPGGIASACKTTALDYAATNFTHTGIETETFVPVGVNAPVLGSM